MSNKIKHQGVVESVGEGSMKVRIMQSSACSGCKVSAHCNASDKKVKIIDIYDKASVNGRKPGDEVTVVATLETGMRAVAIGFGLPFLLMVITVFVTQKLTGNETLAAGLSVAVLMPYYLIIYLMREKLKRRFSFTVE